MKNLKQCIMVFLILTVITGVVYPAAVTGLSRLLFAFEAQGSLVQTGKDVRGSLLIGQKFTSPAYFWPRPSASDYNTMPSGASNLGPTSEALKQAVAERKKQLAPYIPEPIPADLLLGSGSGLDPHISPGAAMAQIDHVARARNLSPEQEIRLSELVAKNVEKPQFAVFGAHRVNVLKLNLDVDLQFGTPGAKGVERN